MSSNQLRILWEQRLAEYETSGLSANAWCREHSIKVNQFFYWRRKLQSDQKERPVKWLPLGLELSKQANPNTNHITVHIEQASIEVKKGFDQQLFCEIVQILRTI
jgi:transposase-like protein